MRADLATPSPSSPLHSLLAGQETERIDGCSTCNSIACGRYMYTSNQQSKPEGPQQVALLPVPSPQFKWTRARYGALRCAGCQIPEDQVCSDR